MKFFLDENIPLSIIKVISKLSFEVEHAINAGLRGASDKEIAEYAKKQNAILITKDVGFGSILLYPKGSHYGLLVLRLPNYFNTEQIAEALKDFFSKVKPENLINHITILEAGKYRIRHI